MDFGVIDTTPSHGLKVVCIHSTTNSQHYELTALSLHSQQVCTHNTT